jgi:hypothetical protein
LDKFVESNPFLPPLSIAIYDELDSIYHWGKVIFFDDRSIISLKQKLKVIQCTYICTVWLIKLKMTFIPTEVWQGVTLVGYSVIVVLLANLINFIPQTLSNLCIIIFVNLLFFSLAISWKHRDAFVTCECDDRYANR